MNSGIQVDYKYFISGLANFLEKMCSLLLDTGNIVAFDFEGSNHGGCRDWSQGAVVYQCLGLSQMMLSDIQFGGGTDARFLFCSGDSLYLACLPEAQPDAHRAMRNYLDGGMEDPHFLLIRDDGVVPLIDQSWSGLVQGERLFSVQHPRNMAICLSYIKKGSILVRGLSTAELIRLYQLLLLMDETLVPMIKGGDVLPFARVASCVIYTSVL